jgi:hypothetical protein
MGFMLGEHVTGHYRNIRQGRKLIDILQLANTNGVLITMDSNSRSRTWHDKLTNGRSKKLEEFIISEQLFIMNEEMPRNGNSFTKYNTVYTPICR